MYCDHCGRTLDENNKCKSYLVEVLPININSARFGESAVLCEKCFWFVQHATLKTKD